MPKLTAMLTGASLVLTLAGAEAAQVDPALRGLPTVDKLPAGAVQISPVVPAMGAHWARPSDLPNGPLYCVIQNRIVCAEYAVSQADLEAGKSFTNIRWPLRGDAKLPRINQLDLNFQPNGHPGFEEPHYDVHIYFISKQNLRRLAPAPPSAAASSSGHSAHAAE